MTAVRFADSLKYGVVMFGYFVVVAALGLGGIALGAVVAVPELSSWLDGDSVEQAALAGGIVLMTLGAAVWFTGLFALVRKLLADAVSVGIADGHGDITLRAPASGVGSPAEPTRTVRRESATNQSGTASTAEETGNGDDPGESPAGNGSETAADTAGGASSGTRAAAEPDESAPRVETEAGERGWSDAGPDDEHPAEDPTGGVEASGPGTGESKKTAEEIAFGIREDETGSETGKGGPGESSTAGNAGTDSTTDVRESVGPESGEGAGSAAGGGPPSESDEESTDSDGTAEVADDDSDRSTDE